MTLLTGALIVGLEVANRFVLVRLYPAFHQGLGAAALLLAPLLAAPWLATEEEQERRPAFFAPLVLAVALAALVPFGARKLAYFDNFRLVLLDRAPLLGRAVELSARIARRAASTTRVVPPPKAAVRSRAPKPPAAPST